MHCIKKLQRYRTYHTQTNIHKLLNNLKNKAEFTITKTIIISVIAAHNIEQYISRGVF